MESGFSDKPLRNGHEDLRLTLESFAELSEQASLAFSNRNATVQRVQLILQSKIVALVASIAFVLYLGFSFKFHVAVIFLVVIVISFVVLKLKLRLIRATKGVKFKEPPIEIGELVASISQGRYRFYRVKGKSSFHLNLIPVKSKQELFATNGPLNQVEGKHQSEKPFFLHKKRVFRHFYKVTNFTAIRNEKLSA